MLSTLTELKKVDELQKEVDRLNKKIEELENKIIERSRWASSLNKFVYENCSKKQTFGNIDLISFKLDQNKKNLMLIEYKELEEKFRPMQETYLKEIGKHIPVYVVRGSQPFNYAYIKNIFDDKYTVINKQQLISFLEFKK